MIEIKYQGKQVGTLVKNAADADYSVSFYYGGNKIATDNFRDACNADTEEWLGYRILPYLKAMAEKKVESIELMDGIRVPQPPAETQTVSSTGGAKGVKPQRYSLIPKVPLDVLGEVYNFGTKKYSPHNYRKGYEWSKSYDALQRHLAAWWEREETDPESGLSHLGHAAFHVFALIVFSSDRRYDQFDDRYKPEG